MFTEGLLIGNKIPKDYVMTKGFGDTDIGWGQDPWEVGAFDSARVMARVEDFNVVRYTSILPPEATEIPLESARALYHSGAVMGSIIAQMNGKRGERVCAGVGRVHVRRKLDGALMGGYVAEYKGNDTRQQANGYLHNSLLAVVSRRYNLKEYEICNEKLVIQEHLIQHKYGTAIALIGFLSYIYPILGRI